MLTTKKKLLLLIIIFFPFFFYNHARAEKIPYQPDPSLLESGDFLWPKKPGVRIPYAFRNLEEIDIGHMGIVELDENKILWVIDASYGRGVMRISYKEWISYREDQNIWVGRLKGFSTIERSKIVEEAKKYIGKPYDFWNLDLNDDTAFYCSKLPWLSIYRALGFAVDYISYSKRPLWFSPKQFFLLPNIEKIYNPGIYSADFEEPALLDFSVSDEPSCVLSNARCPIAN